MIRQAHSYLLGAVSGTALVTVAVVAFVLLVSAQALRSWPIGGLALGGDNSGSVSPARPASQVAAGAAAGKTTASSRSAAKGSAGGTGDTSLQPEVASSAPGPAPSSPTAAAPGQKPSQDSSHAGSGPNPVTSGGGGSGPTGASVPGSVTGTVNDSAAAADEALGGSLSESGVTKVTEKVIEGVNGLAGPNSAVGQTVNEVAGTADGLLGEDR